MVGEDAANSALALSQKSLEIILTLVRFYMERKKDAAPKVKVGKLDQKDINKLIKSGEKLHTINVPSEHVDEIMNYAQRLGGSAGILKTEGNTSYLAVPESNISQMKEAIDLVQKRILTENKEALSIKNKRDELISPENQSTVNATLEYYDIPVFRIQTEDGKQINVVPSDFETEYRNAMVEAEKLQKEIENSIDIDIFTPTTPLSNIDYEIITINEEQAEQLASALGSDIEILQEGDKLAVKVPNAKVPDVNKVLDDLQKEINSVDLEADIAVVDSSITINKSLIEKETETAYLTRIPNTNGEDYIWIDKDDVTLTNNGKTLKYNLDYDYSYKICDKNGDEVRFQTGAELAEKYNTKNVLGNKSTIVTEHLSQTMQRFEVYNPTDNKLMRISLENSEKIKQLLINKGYSPFMADKICQSINNKIKDNRTRDIFSYTKSTPILNTVRCDNLSNLITEAAIAKKVAGAELTGIDTAFSTDKTVCIYDRKANKYTLIDREAELDTNIAAVTEGYADIKRNAIQAIANEKLEFIDTSKPNIGELKMMSSTLPELSNCRYSICDNNLVITMLNEKDIIDYAILPERSKREAIERFLTSDCHMSDLAAAEFIKEFVTSDELSKFVEKNEAEKITGNITIQPLTSKYAALSNGNTTINVSLKNLKVSDLTEKLGLDGKTAAKTAKSLAASLNKYEKAAKIEGKSNLNSLIKNAAASKAAEQAQDGVQRAVEKVADIKGKAHEVESIGKMVR